MKCRAGRTEVADNLTHHQFQKKGDIHKRTETDIETIITFVGTY